jgi:hypothetical protein
MHEPQWEQIAGPLSRRRFLKAVGGVVALGVLPTACTDLPGPLQVPGSLQLKVLAPWEYAVLNAVASRVLGPHAAELIKAGEVNPAAFIDDAFSRIDPQVPDAVRPAIALIEYAPWPVLPKWGRFTRVFEDAQDRALASLETSRFPLFNLAHGGLKLLTAASFYSARASAKITGYDGTVWHASPDHAKALTYPASWPAPKEQ